MKNRSLTLRGILLAICTIVLSLLMDRQAVRADLSLAGPQVLFRVEGQT